MRTLLLSALCTVVLGGCHSRNATLEFTPAALKDCGGNKNAPAAIKVRWDASKAKLKDGVVVRVSNGEKPANGAPGTIWMAGGDSGSATTGAWVFPGTVFFVTDARNGDVLARAVVPAASCT